MRRFGRINFTPAEQLSVIILSLVRGEAYGGRRFAFDCSLRPVADYEENKMQEEEEEEVCLDKRLVAAQSAPQSVWKGIVAELREEDVRGYKNYMRISPELFQELLSVLWYQHFMLCGCVL